MKLRNVAVVGAGEIGESVIEVLTKYKKSMGLVLYVIDTDASKAEEIKKKHDCEHWESAVIDGLDVISICTPCDDNMFPVCCVLYEARELNPDALITVESTLPDFASVEEVILYKAAIFPHRVAPHEPDYDKADSCIRVMGFAEELREVYNFWNNMFMIKKTTPYIAAMSKIVENSIRYVEIALAEELKLIAERHGINFTELRESVNTKWNIDLKEARDGIGRHCLPKDIKFLAEMSEYTPILKAAQEVDYRYKQEHGHRYSAAADTGQVRCV